MFSQWSIAGLAFSILLILMTLMLWVRSYFYFDSMLIGHGAGGTSVAVQSLYGNCSATFDSFSKLGMGPIYTRRAFSRPLAASGLGHLTIQSLLDFGYYDHTYPFRGGGTVRRRIITVPAWSILFLESLIPFWILFRKRRDLQWRVRKDVSWINTRLRMRIGRFVIFSIIGCLGGAIVAFVEVQFPFNEVRWHAFIALAILLPIVGFMAIFTRRRILWYRAILWMGLELAGCVCFFQATIERIWRHYRLFYFQVEDVLQIVLMAGVVCFIFGAVLLLFLQVKPEKAKPGPYCPECGYCLIGLPKRICSECGRPFTLEELGIEEGELAPGNAQAG
jgi:hypothetical protein